jgi:hypothetical protein
VNTVIFSGVLKDVLGYLSSVKIGAFKVVRMGVKVFLKVQKKFTLEQAMKAQRGSRGIALLSFNLDGRWGGWSYPLPCHFSPGKDSVSIVQEAGWAAGPVWSAK